MIDFPIIDSHIHIWDLSLLEYPWLNDVPEIKNTYLVSDYDEARGEQEVEAMVFVQCECNRDQYLDELTWVQSVADNDPRLKAIVPWAPLETGEAIEETLHQMARDPRVKGVRRIIEFEENPDFCIQPDFIRGVQLLGEAGLHFELTIAPAHFRNVIKLIEACPDTRFILDHVGNPDIANGNFQPWYEGLKLFAESGPHYCKFSNLVCNADLNNWNINDLKPYAEAVFENFGTDRLIWGGDWPHVLRASSWNRWFDSAKSLTSHLSDEECRKIYHHNAAHFYRL